MTLVGAENTTVTTLEQLEKTDLRLLASTESAC